MNNDWIFITTIGGLFFGCALSIHFLTVKRPGIAIRWLGLYTLVLTLSLAEFIADKNSTLLTILGSLTFLYGPFLYLYVQARIHGIPHFKWSSIKHFAPFMGYLAIVGYSLSSGGSPNSQGEPIVELLIYELLFIQIFAYCFAGLRIAHSKSIAGTTDFDIEKIQFAFIRVLIYLSIILFAGSFISTHVFIFAQLEHTFTFKYTIQLALCSLILIIALLNSETMHAKKMIKAF